MAGFGNVLRRIAGRLRDQEEGPSGASSEASGGGEARLPRPSTGDEAVARVDPLARATESPGMSFGADPAPGAAVDLPGALVADPVGSTAVDVGQIRLTDDDAITGDPLVSNCPYCGLGDQRIGARCQRCSQVIVRLPAWAQHRRHNWLLSRFSWKRIIFTSIVALLLVFVIWVNYPFAPNPIILFKKIQSQMTADVTPGAWAVSGRDLRNSRTVKVGFPPPKGEVVWQSHIPQPLESEPVAQKSNLFVGSANGIYKLSEYDGQILKGWDGDTPGRITGAAAVHELYLFFGSTDHTVNAWNSLNGDSWWSFPAEDTVEVSPVVSDGLVYISSGKGVLYALDAHNGSVIWETRLDSDASAAVAIHDGRLFVGDDKGIFYILSARTGQEWFRYRTLKTIAGSPVISADGARAYFPSSGQLYAVSALEREVPGLFQFKKVWAQLWLWQVPGIPRPPGQQGGLWKFSPNNPLQGVYSSPALVEDDDGSTLYAGAYDNNMYALDALTGARLWTYSAEDSISASPLVVKDRLIFGDNAGNLFSLNRQNGELDWRINVGSAIKIPPMLSNQFLVVRAEDGDIYGIR